MAKLRIGHMPYVNSAVFYHALSDDDCSMVSLPPRNMAEKMKTGNLDAGPLPIAEVLGMGSSVVPISDLGVAVDGAAHSVLLFSDVPARDLAGRHVAVTSHTSTSVQLLRILLAQFWKVTDVDLAGPRSDSDANLLIGDQALAVAHRVTGSSSRIPFVYDLSLEWRRMTGLPFVFARWVALAGSDTGELTQRLEQAYEMGVKHIDEIARAASIPNMSTIDIANYIRNFTYRLGEREAQAIDEFRSRLSTLPQWSPPIRPYTESNDEHPVVRL